MSKFNLENLVDALKCSKLDLILEDNNGKTLAQGKACFSFLSKNEKYYIDYNYNSDAYLIKRKNGNRLWISGNLISLQKTIKNLIT